jgi:UDP-N-acetyl-D-glucosamine dehydrogenase
MPPPPKPLGLMPFHPGPGLGGPLYPDRFLSMFPGKPKQAGIEARFIELAGYTRSDMPHFVVNKVQKRAVNDAGKPIRGCSCARRSLQGRYQRCTGVNPH